MNSPNSKFQAAVGHIVDLIHLARFQFRNPHSYSKYRVLNRTRALTGSTTLIETGTFRGVTTARCAKVFEHVISIELDPTLATEARNNLRSFRNVEIICGDALDEVPRVLARDTVTNALIFLDGHFSGPGTAHGTIAEPACEEVRRLVGFADKISALVVDDFRCFGVERGWPKKSELIRALEEVFPDFQLLVHMDLVIALMPRRGQLEK